MHLEYFQLIDRIVEIDVGERRITVEAQVPEVNTIFEGHFPGYPLMPGVLLIEAMAQASGWLLIALMKFERMPFLAAVKEAKIKIGGKLKCNATLTFSHIPFPNADLRGHMEAMARKIGFPQQVIVP